MIRGCKLFCCWIIFLIWRAHFKSTTKHIAVLNKLVGRCYWHTGKSGTGVDLLTELKTTTSYLALQVIVRDSFLHVIAGPQVKCSEIFPHVNKDKILVLWLKILHPRTLTSMFSICLWSYDVHTSRTRVRRCLHKHHACRFCCQNYWIQLFIIFWQRCASLTK